MHKLLPLLGLALLACGDKDDGETGYDTSAPTYGDTYAFESAFAAGESSVSYGGQVFRNLLISDMKTHLGGMTDRLNTGALFPVSGDVYGELNFYFEFDSDTAGAIDHAVETDPATAQLTYDDVSSGKDLVGKIAGNDATGQHADWATDFVGWDADGVTTPESLVRHWFDVVDAQAVGWANGNAPAYDGETVPAVYVTPEGQDVQQLLEKFLRAAVAFSQGADDYLDDDIDDKGLNLDHTVSDDGDPYTALEHAWDEGFGYFGASRYYADLSDDEIADVGYADSDGDGAIDLASEYCWGHSVNAAKRDRGSAAGVDMTADAWAGFHGGRALLAATAGSGLTADEFVELQGYRDQAVLAWEQAIASTVVHYINDTLQDMGAADTADYSFADHSKHWSEMKGFALAFQFNPRSPMSDADFATMHDLMGIAPVLPAAGAGALDAYADDLIAARDLIGAAYGFDAADLGDDVGENGW